MTELMPRAVVIEDDAQVSLAVWAILTARGFAVTSFEERPSDLVSTVRSLGADLVVLELAMIGEQGLQTVRDLIEGANCRTVLLLSPFDTLREAALAAGSHDLIGNDMRAIDHCVRRLQSDETTARFAKS